jgi:hypothetical protein
VPKQRIKLFIIILFARIDKDKSQITHEITDVRAATEEVTRSKASAEKGYRYLSGIMSAVSYKHFREYAH